MVRACGDIHQCALRERRGMDHMANEEHVTQLRQGVAAWNSLRAENWGVLVDLSGANLSGAKPEGRRPHSCVFIGNDPR